MTARNNKSRRPRNRGRRDPVDKILTLSNFRTAPYYPITLRLICEPATDATTITGLTQKNLLHALYYQMQIGTAYYVPANGVLAPVLPSFKTFNYFKFKKIEAWGPTGGGIRIGMNYSPNLQQIPSQNKTSSSASVLDRPYDCVKLNAAFPVMCSFDSTVTTEIFVCFYEKTAVAGADGTVILDITGMLYS